MQKLLGMNFKTLKLKLAHTSYTTSGLQQKGAMSYQKSCSFPPNAEPYFPSTLMTEHWLVKIYFPHVKFTQTENLCWSSYVTGFHFLFLVLMRTWCLSYYRHLTYFNTFRDFVITIHSWAFILLYTLKLTDSSLNTCQASNLNYHWCLN